MRRSLVLGVRTVPEGGVVGTRRGGVDGIVRGGEVASGSCVEGVRFTEGLKSAPSKVSYRLMGPLTRFRGSETCSSSLDSLNNPADRARFERPASWAASCKRVRKRSACWKHVSLVRQDGPECHVPR